MCKVIDAAICPVSKFEFYSKKSSHLIYVSNFCFLAML